MEQDRWPDCPDPARPFLVPHDLSDEPLLQMDSLLDLSSRLTPAQFQYNLGDLPEFIDRRAVRENGLTPRETLERIGECGSWMVLKHVETDPAYRALITRILDEVQGAFGPLLRGMHQREGYIFVSSPHSVTPFHMDPEHNVLWQIRGWKEVHQWDPANKAWLPDLLLESFYTAKNHREVQFERVANPGQSFRLEAGFGLHFPFEAPHSVHNGDEVSVSLSTTWRSQYSHRKMSIHQMNAKLRRVGISPSPYGVRPKCDSLKASAMRTLRAVKRLVPGT